MSAFLPKHDPNPMRRERDLSRAQKKYQFNYTHVSPLAILDRVPIHDEFSFQWMAVVSKRILTGLENMAAVEMDADHRDLHLKKHGIFRRMLGAGKATLHSLRHVVNDALQFNPRLNATSHRPESLDDYMELFHHIGLPPIAKDYQEDAAFAWMRLGGPNPVMLQRVKEHDERFPVTDAVLAESVKGDSLDAAIGEGRLYIADYRLLDGVESGDYPHGQKYIYAPFAMFIVDRTTKQLLPIAIQLGQEPGAGCPIFTPKDGWNWLIAKTMVEVADGNVHEAYTHLGRTHLFIEPFVVTTYRQLAPKHPVAKLLGPHFESTLAINDAAWKHLIANKGAVEKLCSASLNSARKLTVEGVQSMKISEALLPKTFADRGVADSTALPNYPYRDDSMLYWQAINKWVADYIGIYYSDDAEVVHDNELAAWNRELVAKDGARISGLGDVSTITQLVDLLTLIIYTCSVQHAAVNFPQYDLMSYVPNMPLASYKPAPISKSGATEQDYLDMLPPMDMAELQLDLGYLLGSVHYTQLGQYEHGHFIDGRVSEALQNFQKAVADIGSTIAERNSHRRPYQFLDPRGIPQSINI